MKKILAIVSMVLLVAVVAGCTAPTVQEDVDGAMDVDDSHDDSMDAGMDSDTMMDESEVVTSESQAVASDAADIVDDLDLDNLDNLDAELDESELTLE